MVLSSPHAQPHIVVFVPNQHSHLWAAGLLAEDCLGWEEIERCRVGARRSTAPAKNLFSNTTSTAAKKQPLSKRPAFSDAKHLPGLSRTKYGGIPAKVPRYHVGSVDPKEADLHRGHAACCSVDEPNQEVESCWWVPYVDVERIRLWKRYRTPPKLPGLTTASPSRSNCPRWQQG
jgi:hypothetical protein